MWTPWRILYRLELSEDQRLLAVIVAASGSIVVERLLRSISIVGSFAMRTVCRVRFGLPPNDPEMAPKSRDASSGLSFAETGMPLLFTNLTATDKDSLFRGR